jgi:HK97 gp10 family phage protein
MPRAGECLMAMPKSVIKVKKDGVEYISNVDKVQYTITELSRGALRDVAKLLRRKIKDAVPVDTGTLKKNVGTWVRRSKDAGLPWLQVGVYDKKRAEKKGYAYAYHAHFNEFGTRKMQAANNGRGFLRSVVQDNIDEIRKIQGQYLSAIEDENKALGLIDEEEEIADD